MKTNHSFPYIQNVYDKKIIPFVMRHLRQTVKKVLLRFLTHHADPETSASHHPNTIKLRENTETFRGIYATLDAAANQTSYDSKKSLMTGRSRVLEHELRARANTTELLPADPRCQIDNLIALLIAARPMTSRFTVLDYGGGMGETFFKIAQSTSTNQLDYIIYDTPNTRTIGRALFEAFPSYPVRYIDQISEEAIQPNIIYLGSVLQYLPDYKSTMNELCALGAETILLTDQWVTMSDSFVTGQVNEPDRVIPMWIFSVDEIIARFHESGYRLAYRTSNYQPWVRTGELSAGITIGDSVNLLFLRS